jgi:hypothetical protein
MLLFYMTTYQKLQLSVFKFKVITPSLFSERLRVCIPAIASRCVHVKLHVHLVGRSSIAT